MLVDHTVESEWMYIWVSSLRALCLAQLLAQQQRFKSFVNEQARKKARKKANIPRTEEGREAQEDVEKRGVD